MTGSNKGGATAPPFSYKTFETRVIQLIADTIEENAGSTSSVLAKQIYAQLCCASVIKGVKIESYEAVAAYIKMLETRIVSLVNEKERLKKDE